MTKQVSIQITKPNEFIRIKGDEVSFTVRVVSAKDGDFFVHYIPSINLSAYGETKEEAKQSLSHNIQMFALDLLSLSPKNLDREMLKMGFKKERLNRKNFSRLVVDGNGELKDLGFEDHELELLNATVPTGT